MNWKARFAVGCGLGLALLAGCSKMSPNSTAAANGGKFYAVTAETTSFYRYGPQQASGPDQRLQKGTLMTLIRPSFGYCKVRLTSGEQGFVSNDDVGVASASLVAAANTPARESARFHLDSPDPRLSVPPEPLPEFEPTPIPEPSPSSH